MKKILLLFLLISTFGFSQEEDYSKIFSNFDSINKHNLFSHINRVMSAINYEFVKENQDSTRKVIITVKLDSVGKLILKHIEEKNNDLKDLYQDIFQKIPLIEIIDSDNKRITNKYITLKFTLHKDINVVKWNQFIFKNPKDSSKGFKELDIYPSFGKFKKNYDKEKSMKDFNKKMSKHIIDNFKYPEYAVNNNITGKTFVCFTIEKDGSIERIIVTDANPILHYTGIEIITKFPKFNPGYLNNEPVRVSYGFPLTFKLQ